MAAEAEKKRLAAEEAAAEKARLEAAMAEANKEDPAYIAARNAFIQQAVTERIVALERDTALAIEEAVKRFETER